MTIRPLGFFARPRLVSPTAYAALKTHLKAQWIAFSLLMFVTAWASQAYASGVIFLGGMILTTVVYLIWYALFVGPIVRALPESDME